MYVSHCVRAYVLTYVVCFTLPQLVLRLSLQKGTSKRKKKKKKKNHKSTGTISAVSISKDRG